MGYWTTDADANRVLRGLPVAGTEELQRLWKADLSTRDTARYLELSRKHELAHAHVIATEVQGRDEPKH
jgi:hypothetical protein